MVSKAAQELGRKGGQVKSDAKTVAARENAKKPRRKWVTAIAYELEGVEKYKSFGSVVTKGKPPEGEEAYFEWVRNKVRSNGVGLSEIDDLMFTQLSTRSMFI